MAICDICNKELSGAETTIVKTDLIEKATRHGYISPMVKAMSGAFSQYGMSAKDLWANTVAGGAATDWALCADCHKDIVKHANRGCFIATAAIERSPFRSIM